MRQVPVTPSVRCTVLPVPIPDKQVLGMGYIDFPLVDGSFRFHYAFIFLPLWLCVSHNASRRSYFGATSIIFAGRRAEQIYLTHYLVFFGEQHESDTKIKSKKDSQCEREILRFLRISFLMLNSNLQRSRSLDSSIIRNSLKACLWHLTAQLIVARGELFRIL